MYKNFSRFIQQGREMASDRPRKVSKSGKNAKYKPAAIAEACKDPAVIEAVKVSAERIRKRWAKKHSRGGKVTGRILPSLAQD